ISEKDRIGIGGNSYGAFLAVNLLANTDLFSAGIARSGAYNRTLTPFGFQNEERFFWQVPDVYLQMSPIFRVRNIQEPLLLFHGRKDDNSGTFPMQSERLFQALRGMGGTARLVLFPHEGHTFRAEMELWLDLYVQKDTYNRRQRNWPQDDFPAVGEVWHIEEEGVKP
ncbi:MAG: prolyl oligopeptidase family serine peptidase, partial [Opitutae bacterium]|nr:prolyl oligopeptidase family serine peptidase [Opitutae bacterium]